MRRNGSLRAPILALFALAACTDGVACGCLSPAPRELPDEALVFDGAQLWLGADAFTRIEAELPAMVEQFLPGGLSFVIPPGRLQEGCLFGACAVDTLLCSTGPGCPITAALGPITLERRAPNRLVLVTSASAVSTLDLVGTPTCDVDIAITDRRVTLDVTLQVDPLSHALGFQLGPLSLPLQAQDFTIRGGAECGTLEALLPLFLPTFQQNIDDELAAQLAAAQDPINCMACGHYAAQDCTTGASCAGDPAWCRPGGDPAALCVNKPQGLEGVLPAGAALAEGLTPEPSGFDLGLALFAGQRQPTATQRPIDRDGAGVRVNLVTGALAAGQTPCVPACEAPDCVAPARLPPGPVDFPLAAAELGLPPPPMALAISDAFLDAAAFEAWRAGLFCITIDAKVSSALSTQTFSALAASLASLDGGKAAPMRIALRPQRPPDVIVGAGRDGAPILVLRLPELALDFSALIFERYVRLFTVVADLEVPLSLTVTPEGLVPSIGDLGSGVTNLRGMNSELLEEDPQDLAVVLPTLLDLAGPSLAGGLPPIALPELLPGFALQIDAVAGLEPKPSGDGSHEQLGLFLSIAP